MNPTQATQVWWRHIILADSSIGVGGSDLWIAASG
jgi:hypothetical protein